MNKKLLLLPLLGLLIGCSSAEHVRQPSLLGNVYPTIKQRLEKVRNEVGEHRLNKEQTGAIACLAQNLNFPGGVTFAALGQSAKTDSGLMDSLSNAKPSSVSFEEALTLIKNRASQKVGITDSQAKEALRILREKQFLGDVRDVTISVLGFSSRLPGSLAKDFPSLSTLPRELGISSVHDIRSLRKNPREVAKLLLNREGTQKKPAILKNTLKVLASKATYKEVTLTSQKLLENESVRLAIIIYAQSNGIEIDQDDLDAVAKFLAADEPNLDELSTLAAQAFVTRYGGRQATSILHKMTNRSKRIECK